MKNINWVNLFLDNYFPLVGIAATFGLGAPDFFVSGVVDAVPGEGGLDEDWELGFELSDPDLLLEVGGRSVSWKEVRRWIKLNSDLRPSSH